MEREGNNPIAPLVDAWPGVNDGSVGKRKVGSELVRFGAWARGLPSGKTMTFHVDPRVFSDGEKRIARVVYLDQGVGTWQLKQSCVVKLTVTNENTGNWNEKEVVIETDGNQYEIVNTGSEEVIFHMLEVKRATLSTAMQSFNGTSQFVEVYPNPVSKILNFRFLEMGSEKKISFYNVAGQLLNSVTTCNKNYDIDIRSFSKGEMLIVKVISGDTTASFKVICQV
jgi:hypothetical protein